MPLVVLAMSKSPGVIVGMAARSPMVSAGGEVGGHGGDVYEISARGRRRRKKKWRSSSSAWLKERLEIASDDGIL